MLFFGEKGSEGLDPLTDSSFLGFKTFSDGVRGRADGATTLED